MGGIMEHINWLLLGESIQFYKNRGFKYIETPWFVESANCLITCDNRNALVEIKDTYEDWSLVGSAEQGFIQHAKDGRLATNNYVSCGPCFRKEPTFDELHHPQFMKVELFTLCDSENDANNAAQNFIKQAFVYMAQHSSNLNIITTSDGQDIELNDIEVGSYGYRYDNNIGWWAYGTGLAEPRFSQAICNHET